MWRHGLATICVLASMSGAAFGQVAGSADASFQRGRDLISKGDVAAACQAFAESLRLEDTLGTLLNLAYCHEQEGKLPDAWREYRIAGVRAVALQQEKRARFAEQQRAALERRLAFVSLDPDSLGPAMSVFVDGVAAERARVVERVAVMPGDCRIEVRARGHRAWSRTFRLAAGGSALRIVVPPLEADDTAGRLPPATPTPRPPSARRTWGYVIGAAGLATVGTGAYFGLRTLSTKEKADESCVGNACNDRGLALYADARRYSTISTVTIGVGVAAVGAAAWLLLFDNATTAPAVRHQGTGVSPVFSPQSAGVRVNAAW